MEVDKKNRIILSPEDDCEYVRLINHIQHTEYGEITLEVKKYRPYRITQTIKSTILPKKNK